MGGQDHVRHRQQRVVRRGRLLLQHVEAGRPQPPGDEGLGQRHLVHHAAPAGVDEDGVGPQAGQLGRADQVVGVPVERGVHRDDVGALEQLAQRG